ncbi:DUF938 domain-containing protein [Breoghania sp. L-A4]|uniref:DUF938 domain-containing protein n=1 Tax=Breoghania sp. L-A4 TaxID=2304600 RepID=UPI000E35F840|nr:DUF938 domain-containing protein [Breoghania sp. L-A4]AXS40908.1 DUF938 domain-containing protein [Breoghania sp. L-A4]
MPLDNSNPLPSSQAAENNKEPIAGVLRDAFANVNTVLEIASGTGQHAVHMAIRMPHLTWQPTDLEPNLPGLEARFAREPRGNIRPPLLLDIGDQPWPVESTEAVFTANSLHIVSWPLVEAFFKGVGRVLAPGGMLAVYGPFKYGGAFTTPSNAQFDAYLRSRDPQAGIRDIEAVDALAKAQELELVADHAMPANNQLLVWKRT